MSHLDARGAARAREAGDNMAGQRETQETEREDDRDESGCGLSHMATDEDQTSSKRDLEIGWSR